MRSLLFCSFLLVASVVSVAQQNSTTIILVRHAEKGFHESGDPDLTESGQRAKELVRVLEKQRIDAVYSTPFKRTRQTVEPLATNRGLSIEEYNPFKLEETIELIKASTGRVLLFSGHSNTVPVMLNLMKGKDVYKMLDEKSYDNLFIVTFRDVTNAEIIHLKYGDPTE